MFGGCRLFFSQISILVTGFCLNLFPSLGLRYGFVLFKPIPDLGEPKSA